MKNLSCAMVGEWYFRVLLRTSQQPFLNSQTFTCFDLVLKYTRKFWLPSFFTKKANTYPTFWIWNMKILEKRRHVVSVFRIVYLDVMSNVQMMINLGKIVCYICIHFETLVYKIGLLCSKSARFYFNFLFSKYSIVD